MAFKRAACDECHQAKSRCSKDSGSCKRCIRLQLSCTFSPPLRMGRPGISKAYKTVPTHVNGVSRNDAIRTKSAGGIPTQTHLPQKSQSDRRVSQAKHSFNVSFCPSRGQATAQGSEYSEHHFGSESVPASFPDGGKGIVLSTPWVQSAISFDTVLGRAASR